MEDIEKLWENAELLQAQIDANTILLVALAAYLENDAQFADRLKRSFEGFMATRLNHAVSQRYLDALQNSLAAKLPPPLRAHVQ